jgi:FtsP/CotA-like multicopper oxidase with cupredoxin domain
MGRPVGAGRNPSGLGPGRRPERCTDREHEIPLLIFDRQFTADDQLYYPTSGLPEAPWVSEAYGDAILINGKLAPYLQVEPRRCRFSTAIVSTSMNTLEPAS